MRKNVDQNYLDQFLSSCVRTGLKSEEIKIKAETEIAAFQRELNNFDNRKKEVNNKLTSLRSLISNFKIEKNVSSQIDPNSKFLSLPEEFQEICNKIHKLFVNSQILTARQIMNTVADLSKNAVVYSCLSWLETHKIVARNQDRAYITGRKWEFFEEEKKI